MVLPIEKLQKFIKLEIDRGYDNRAVLGGLDKILPTWENEALSSRVDAKIIETVTDRLKDYHRLDTQARSEAIQELLALLQTYQKTAAPVEKVEAPRKDPATEIKGDDDIRPSPANRPRQPKPGAPYKGQAAKSRFAEPPPSVGLNAPLTVIPGIGPNHSRTLNTLGLNSLEDLLYYYPRRYDDYSQMKPINRIQFEDELSIIATVQTIDMRPARSGNRQIIEAIATDGTGFIRLTWFNKPYLLNHLKAGDQIVLSGKVGRYLGRLVMNEPDWETLDQEHLHTTRIVPVYPLAARITQRWLRRIMHQTVSFWAERVPDFLPKEVVEAAGLVDLPTALQQVHYPDSIEKLQSARERLAFQEIFLLQLGVLSQKRSWQSLPGQVFETDDQWLEAEVQKLPFALTGAQLSALQDIRADFLSGQPMNRLLQGDVGSGKTVIAAMAIAMVLRHGAQAALMAPTSILSEQHYNNMLKMLPGIEKVDGNLLDADEIRLLVGDTSEAEKQEIRDGLAEGRIKLVIGTHALIEDPVGFKNLSLVVIDEQHRFGVAQRSAIRVKGENPHLLVMTATPIPRSLALTVYGDLDLTVMDEMPAGRQPVDTYILHPLERERAYQLVRKQIEDDHQAFIICPLVEGSDQSERKAAVDEYERLQKEIFPQLNLGLLHGRMKPEEKDEVMSRFRNEEYHILVSTSVVEVGVDIPNATVMLIEGANRFGLAQLHQFRGRVGRGGAKAYCLLIAETSDAVENERLAAMTETNDGFVLAEKDLQQRGPGEFLGTRQSGYSELRMANITDVRLIEKARHHAKLLFEQDPDLNSPELEPLKAKLACFWEGGKGDVS